MGEPLYGLTGRTVDRLGQILGDYGEVGGRAGSSAPARGSTWVKVTGAISGSWYPGVVSLDVDGTFTDLAAAVNVKSADGSALTSGQRYLCTRTGDSAGGVAQFRTLAGISSGFVSLSSDFNFTSPATAALSITTPNVAGMFSISADVAWDANVTGGGNLYAYIRDTNNYPLGPYFLGQYDGGVAMAGWKLNGQGLNSTGGSWTGGPAYVTYQGGSVTYELMVTRGTVGTWTSSKLTNGVGVRGPTMLRWAKIG